MPDEIDVEGEENITKNKVEERITSLSNKVKTTAEERDVATKAKAEAEAKAIEMEKERDFYASFSDSATKYPGAIEYKDQIKEKVLAGYSVEDATVSVLNREGKFQPQPVNIERDIVAGGSSVNKITQQSSKSLNEMTRDEKRQALIEADNRGELEPILRRGLN